MGKIEIKDWQSCGTMACIQNAVAEPTVDATFRRIEAFNQSLGANNLDIDLVDNTITFPTLPVYNRFSIVGTAKFIGSNKTFELGMFMNGVQGTMVISDKGSGDATLSGTLENIPSGAVLEARQRSTDGGISLVVESMTITIERLV